MLQGFYLIPVRDNFKDVHYGAVTLRAPPTLARVLFIVEMIFTIFIFIISYYYSASTSTEVTTISFEVLGDPYTCTLLSPRSDAYEFTTDNSELVQFSDARLGYSACMSHIGPNGYDLCNKNRDDYLLTLDGIGASDAGQYDCQDIILSNGLRLCYGKTETYNKDIESMGKSFYQQSNPYTTKYDAASFYFMNSSTHVYSVPSSIDYTTISSEYVTDLHDNVYVIAKNSKTQHVQLFRIHPGATEAEPLLELMSSNIYGFAYGSQALFVYMIDQQNVRLIKYNITTKATTTANPTCSTVSASIASTSRLLSYGDDDNLYFLCTDMTTTTGGTRTLSISRYNAFTMTSTGSGNGGGGPNGVTSTSTLNAQFTNLNFTSLAGTITTNKITKIDQVFMINNKIYLIATGEATNVLQGHFVPGTNTVNGFTNLGATSGYHATRESHQRLYFPGSGLSYFDTVTGGFGAYSNTTFRGTFYHPLVIQLAYSYQICNNTYTHAVIDGSSSSSFRKKCWNKNGFYYQNNEYMEVPTTCRGAMHQQTDTAELLTCPAMNTLHNSFLSGCSDTYDKICDQEYTQNPPFSCTEDTYPSTLTNLSTAFANGSAAFSFMVILSRLLCKILYPHGVVEFDYDPEHERYLPPGSLAEQAQGKKIHPVLVVNNRDGIVEDNKIVPKE